MKISNKTILVTGGAGFIGSHTCKILKKNGYIPIVFDNLSTGYKKSVEKFKLIKGDLSNKRLLKKTISIYKPEAIFHFAALTSIPDSLKYPEKYFKNNVVYSKNLIDIASSLGVNKFIFSSSCAVYGNYPKNPVRLTSKTKPSNNYAKGKLIIEKYLKKNNIKKTLSSVSLRYFNASGADPELEIGDMNFNSKKLIPRIMYSIIKKKKFFINGSNYRTKDGTCIRDFIHVCDLANAHLSALKYLKKNKGAYKFNLGSGKGHSILEIIRVFEKITNLEVKYIFKKRRNGDVPELYTKKKEIKNFVWSPKRSKLFYIINDSWLWYKKNLKKIK